jgi:hypothetical protein
MLTRTSALETPVSSPEEARALQQHRLCVYTKTSEDNIVHRLWHRSDNNTTDSNNWESDLRDFMNNIDVKHRPSST